VKIVVRSGPFFLAVSPWGRQGPQTVANTGYEDFSNASVVKRSVKPVLRDACGERGVWKLVLDGLLRCGKGAPSCLVCLMAGLDLVMGTIMIEHKMGGMLDRDLIEENL